MPQTFNYILKSIYYISLLYFSFLMILITAQYIPLKLDVAFLNVKDDVIGYKHYQIAFFSHVYTSIFTLLLGIPQFSSSVRLQFPTLHKNLGKLYILLIICIASPSGLVMAFYANGGVYSKISFTLQAILWFVFTYKAYSFAKEKNWIQHKKFMYRSYALTLSAISLRLFKWIIVSTIALPPMDTYKIVSWLGWLVNLILVELYLINRVKPSKKTV